MGGKSDFKKLDSWGGPDATRTEIDKLIMGSEIAPHKKKKEKPHKKRADHKHIWQTCLLEPLNDTDHLYIGKRCDVCGELQMVRTWVTIKTENGYYRTVKDPRELPEYKDAPIYKVEDVFKNPLINVD